MSSLSRPPYRRVVATEAAELETALYAAGHDPDAPEAERIWDIWLYRGLRAALAALEPKDEEPMATQTKVIRGLQVVENRPQTAQQRLAALQQLTALSHDLDMDVRDVLSMAVAQLHTRELGETTRDWLEELDDLKQRVAALEAAASL